MGLALFIDDFLLLELLLLEDLLHLVLLRLEELHDLLLVVDVPHGARARLERLRISYCFRLLVPITITLSLPLTQERLKEIIL